MDIDSGIKLLLNVYCKTMNTITFPGVSDRIKASFADSIILIVFLIVISYLLSALDISSTAVKVCLLILFFLYNPLLTCFLGGTIGHFMLGIRIKQEKDYTKNINIIAAIIRFIFKLSLGWLSLLTISKSQQRRALHDMMCSSVVIYPLVTKPISEAV